MTRSSLQPKVQNQFDKECYFIWRVTVLINKNVSSSFFNIHSAVKQGGPLSPVLFVLFINDL